MKRLAIILAFAGALAMAPMASAVTPAQRRHANIEQRQRWQAARTAQGVRSGALTYREAQQLRAQQRRIERQEDRFQASGGRFTPRERAQIQRELNWESRQIYRQKHDGQVRGWGWR